MSWAIGVDEVIREGSVNFDPTMNYSVFTSWKVACKVNRGLVISICKDEV